MSACRPPSMTRDIAVAWPPLPFRTVYTQREMVEKKALQCQISKNVSAKRLQLRTAHWSGHWVAYEHAPVMVSLLPSG